MNIWWVLVDVMMLLVFGSLAYCVFEIMRVIKQLGMMINNDVIVVLKEEGPKKTTKRVKKKC